MIALLLHGLYLRLNLQKEMRPKQNILKKALSDGPSLNLRPLFNSTMTQVSVIKWSQNCTRTIKSGVVGIPKYLKNACKAVNLNMDGYAKKNSDGPSSILRQLYNRYFCHITIEKWYRICTRIIINVYFRDILYLGSFPIVIPIVNLFANLDHEGADLFLWLISAQKDTIKTLSQHVGCF